MPTITKIGKINLDIYVLLNDQVWDDMGMVAGDKIIFTEINLLTPWIKNNKTPKSIEIIYENDQSMFSIKVTFTDGTNYYINDDGQSIWWEYNLPTYFNVENDEIVMYGKITCSSDWLLGSTPVIIDENVNVIMLYHLNSSNNTVTKSITWIATYPVTFNRPITYRNLMLDVKLGANDVHFNYVYIASLHRYYFVTEMTLTNDWSQLTLHEDVLMSFDALIRSQTAFVERNENNYDTDKTDNLISFDYDKRITTSTISLATGVTVFTVDETKHPYVLSVVAKQ